MSGGLDAVEDMPAVKGNERRTRRTSISRSILLILTGDSTFPLRISFTATSSPHCMCSPNFTLPNSPSPSVLSSRYGPNFGMVRFG